MAVIPLPMSAAEKRISQILVRVRARGFFIPPGSLAL
jgi:hypothetical protein